MEKLRLHKIHIPLFALLLFLLQFLSLQVVSSDYTPPNKYFINCGSPTNVNNGSRIFVGDMNSHDPISSSVSLRGRSVEVEDSKQSSGASSVYQTARVFRQNFAYEFDIEDNGTYFVRLHFFAFSSPSSRTDLSVALFDVWTSGFSLLLNFTPKNSSNSPILKEFLLSTTPGKLQVFFVPLGSSFAFVNAIEVFLAPPDVIPEETRYVVSPAGIKDEKKRVFSDCFQSLYRINVGNYTVTPDEDKLWRNWDPDDRYIYNGKAAAANPFYQKRPNYLGNVTEYTAPSLVYQTAKQINVNGSSQLNSSNITWSFNVSKNARHLVRVHFCDFISTSLDVLGFNLNIFSNYNLEINSYEYNTEYAVPFCIDFVVDSDESGHINIGIGPRADSDQKSAFLNGLEIKEIMENSGSAPTVEAQKNNRVFVIAVSIVGSLVLICILVVVLVLVFRHRKAKPVDNSDWLPVPVHGGGSSHSRVTEGTINGSPVPNLNFGLKMPFSEIQFVTNNFDKRLQIGKGGFGNVYRGTLRNGTKVAVKRSQPGSNQGVPEFQTEILILSKIHHRHLVSLIGYCDEGSEMILVYEFMEKGTLRDHLYASDNPRLSWKQRLEICIGAAKGLHYLHRGSSAGTIHRDVKSNNILLDDNYVAKVADFGLSKSGPLDETHFSTVVKGTFGYLDPEYFKCQQLTEKSDVYSFGVVLLEVLCARPAIDQMLPREQVNLADWALRCSKKGLLEELVDPFLKGQIDPNSQRKFVETTEKCLEECGSDRPNMADVLWDLEYALQLHQNATRREPHEDSTTDASAAFMLINVQRCPSLSTAMDRDEMSLLADDGSNSEASDVFSQMRLNDAR